MNTKLNYKTRCNGFARIADNIWFSECKFNALICMGISDGKIKKILKIPNHVINRQNLFSEIFVINKSIILIPLSGNEIVSYNIDKDSFSCVSIKKNIEVPSISKYRAAYQHEHEIITFPNKGDKIIIYNHREGKVLTIDIKNSFLDELYPDRKIQFRPQFEVWNGTLYIPFAEAGAILKMDLVTKQTEIKMVKGLSGCDTINYYNGLFYLAAWNEKKIYAIDTDFQIVKEYTDYPKELTADEHIFAYSLLMENKIVYFPQACNMIVSFDLEDESIKEEVRINSSSVDFSKTYIAKMIDNKIISLMTEDSWLSSFSINKGILQKKQYCAWDNVYNSRIIEQYLIENGYFNNSYENNEIGLNIFIDQLNNVAVENSFRKLMEGAKTTGEVIYQSILGD